MACASGTAPVRRQAAAAPATARRRLDGPLVVVALASLACLLWGTATPVIRLGYRVLGLAPDQTGSLLVFAGMRFFLAGLAVTLAHALASPAARRLPTRTELGLSAQLSLFQTFGQYLCTYIGAAHATGVSGSLLQGTSVFVTLLISSLVFRMERLTARKTLGCVVGFCGVALSAGDLAGAGFSLDGEGLIVCSTVMASMSTVLMARHSQGHSPVLLCGWQFMLGGAALAAVGLALGGRVDLAAHPAGALALAWLAMVSAVAYGTWSQLLRDNEVSRVAVFEFEIPVFGVLVSLALLGPEGTTVGLATAASLALVTLGIWIVERGGAAGHEVAATACEGDAAARRGDGAASPGRAAVPQSERSS